MKRFGPLIVSFVLVVSASTVAVTARADTPIAHYSIGWNMAIAPPRVDLSTAEAVYSYDGRTYVLGGVQTASACAAEWAYFPTPTTLQLSNALAAAQTCMLQPGWNMVGNPFATPAILPAGTVAYYWNPSVQRYDMVDTIPTGGAVWLNPGAAASITLQPTVQATPSPTSTEVPVSTPTPSDTPQPTIAPRQAATVVITPPFQSEYQVHLGDTVELRLSNPPGYTATADPAFLQPIDSGTTGSNPATLFWHWRAVSAGSTIIVVDPACRQATPPCGAPTLAVRIVVLGTGAS